MNGEASEGAEGAFVATGDAAFGTPFASSSSESFTTQASKFVFGATNSNAVNATFDDIKLDSAAMPGPSGGGSPTATPTNTLTNTPTPGGPTATPTNTPTPVPTAPPAYDISMTYDAIGNITSKTGLGSYGLGAQSASCPAGALDKAHTVVSTSGASYCYDRNGNMQTGGAWTYTWNADNTLASMTNGTAPESYTYDADGERVVRSAANVTTVFFEGVWEQTTGGARKLYYTFNGQVVAMRDMSVTPNVVTYLHGDHLGSVSVATDSSGTGYSTQEFDPWGQVRACGIGATSLNYTGQRLDATGLLYYHARYYNPVLARFISADSVVPGAGALAVWPSDATASPLFAQGPKNKDGKLTAPQDPQTLNRYSYVNNNPLKSTDPTGHCIGPAIVICAAAIVVAAYLIAGGTVAVHQSGVATQLKLPQISLPTISLPSPEELVEGTWGKAAGMLFTGAELALDTVLLMKGEYIPPGLKGPARNKYREAVHRYKKAYGLPADYPVPKDILDQIAEDIKDGANAVDAADNADPPPEGDDDDPPSRKGKKKH